MPRPDFITKEEIERWDKIIEEEIAEPFCSNLLFKEVCYAGQWLGEQLLLLGCSEENITKIVYTAGKQSFGRDTWEVSKMLLNAYENNELEYEKDYQLN
jgi:hypothetical protein